MSSFKYKILINDSANEPKNLTKRYFCTHCEQEKWISTLPGDDDDDDDSVGLKHCLFLSNKLWKL